MTRKPTNIITGKGMSKNVDYSDRNKTWKTSDAMAGIRILENVK